MPLYPPCVEEPCPEGCDLGCEVHATWTPDPARAFHGHGPGYVFKPDGKGGGVLLERSKTTYRWREVAKVVPYGA